MMMCFKSFNGLRGTESMHLYHIAHFTFPRAEECCHRDVNSELNLRICNFCLCLNSGNNGSELMGEENPGETEWNSYQESYGRYQGRTDTVGVGREGKVQICCWRFLKVKSSEAGLHLTTGFDCIV